MNPPDDRRLTDYAVDEIDTTARAALEQRLERDADLRVRLGATREAIDALGAAWSSEPRPQLSGEQRARILRAAGARTERAPPPALPRLLRPLAFAAGLAAAVFVAATQRSPFERDAVPERVARGLADRGLPDRGLADEGLAESGSTGGADLLVNPSRADADVEWALTTYGEWTSSLEVGAFPSAPPADVGERAPLTHPNWEAVLDDLRLAESRPALAALLVRPRTDDGLDLGKLLPGYFETYVVRNAAADDVRLTVPRDVATGTWIAGRLLGGRGGPGADTPAVVERVDAGLSVAYWHPAAGSSGAASPFVSTAVDPDSSFPLHLATLSGGLVREAIEKGRRPAVDDVRVAELVNGFVYDDLAALRPAEGAPGDALLQVASCPWTPAHRIVRVGVRAATDPERSTAAPSNFVFVVDTAAPEAQATTKVPLMRQSIRLFLNDLGRDDQVALVTYDQNAELRVASTPSSVRVPLLAALDGLESRSTAPSAASFGQALDLAWSNFSTDAVNHVVIATDRDPEVLGDSLRALSPRSTAVRLAFLALGEGRQPELARVAAQYRGRFAAVTSPAEARAVLNAERTDAGSEATAALQARVEFNPVLASSYRLLGFEPQATPARGTARLPALRTQTTALYEVVPHAADGGGNGALHGGFLGSESTRRLVTVRLRSLASGGERETVRTADDAIGSIEQAPRDFRFATAVAGYGLLLRGTLTQDAWSLDEVAALAETSVAASPERRRFVDLVRRTAPVLPPR